MHGGPRRRRCGVNSSRWSWFTTRSPQTRFVSGDLGDNIVSELLRDVETYFEWDHDPPGDVYDTQTYSQFYYHAHP